MKTIITSAFLILLFFISLSAVAQNLSLVDDINSGSGSSIPNNGNFPMVKFNDHQYILLADDGVHNVDPWITDGTPGGTYLLHDFESSGNSYYAFSKAVNGRIFFWVRNLPLETSDEGLWVTDGTAGGTVQLDPVLIANPADCAVIGNILYFTSYTTASSFSRLYRSDGTVPGTYSISPTNLISAADITAFNNKIYFRGSDVTHGSELWTSDGTLSGTKLLKDIVAGSSESHPSYFTSFNGKLYFGLQSFENGELWVTDGTTQGTTLVKDVYPGAVASTPRMLTVSGNKLYFKANYLNTGYELWKSDGSAVGTSLVKDIYAGKKDGVIESLTDVNGVLYFIGKDSINGSELWKSDGTEAGTMIVKNIANGKASSILLNLTNVNGDLYFISRRFPGEVITQDLWRSDGTECGTQQIDLNIGEGDMITFLTSDSNKIFFFRETDIYGSEPWKYITAPITTYETCNGIDDDCNGIVDDNALVATITPSGNISACDGELVSLNAYPTGDDLNYNWYYNGNLIGGATTSSLSSSILGGSVQVVVSSFFGCTDTSDITIVNRVALPNAKITAAGSLDICSTGSVILKVNTGMGYSYQWMLNNSPIPGATKKQYTATAVGNYKVTVTNSYACSKTSKKVTVLSSCKMISLNTSEENELELYPNPTNGNFTIKISSPENLTGPFTIIITDVLGRKVLQQKYSAPGSENEFIIKLNGSLSNGLYHVIIESTGYSFQQSFELNR